jgi:outer membrane protein TolC
MCSRLALALVLLSLPTPVGASDGVPEAQLVRAALDGGAVHARIDATRARGDAAGVAAPLLDNPVLEARHEQANGLAGASTDFVGGTLGFGLGGGAEARAARLRGQAADAWLRADVVAAICTVRRDALELWRTGQRAAAAARAQGRLRAVLDRLGALAEAGEAAGYDRDRMALAVATHQHTADSATVERVAAHAALSAQVSAPVTGVALSPLAPPPDRVAALDTARSSDPILEALRLEREAAERAWVAARRAALPELTLSGGARWDAMPDGSERTPGFEVGAGLSLPAFDRNRSQVATRNAAVAELDARIAAREAALVATVAAAWEQAALVGPPPVLPSTESVWRGALDRYAAGEATIDELLTVAADLEAAEAGAAAGEALRRSAGLDLSCTVGAFPEPAIQDLLEEHAR